MIESKQYPRAHIILEGRIMRMLMLGQLGVFLCMRCAALHRKLGTHITKVKSLSMDSWSNEQVEVCCKGAPGAGQHLIFGRI